MVDQELKSIECIEPKKENFGYQSSSTFTFPNNCGLGFINLQYSFGQVSNNVKLVD